MADTQIKNLTSYASPQDADVLPIVDDANNETKKIAWSTIKSALNSALNFLAPTGNGSGLTGITASQVGAQAALGFTPENVANKSTTLDTDKASDTKYSSVKSIYDWATGLFWTNSSTSTGTNKTFNSNTNYIDADATHQKVFLALGRAGLVGDAVYVSAWNVANGCAEVSLARANAAGTLPCAGVLESAGADGTVQSMRVEGLLNNVNTNAYSAGTRLYVSAATAGALTSTRPTTPNFDQAIGTVVYQNATTGIIDVVRTAYVGTMAYADTASYELVANKSTTTALGTSDTLYPTQNAVKTYVDGIVAGLLDYRGAYNASVNTFPAAGGSGTAGAVMKGDMWIVSVAGTLGGTAVQIGDSLIASVDTPAQIASNWNILNANISYVPEDAANKVTSISGASTDTQYASAKLTYDQLALKAALAGSTGQAFSVSQLEVGAASDTTITRVGAGVIAVEGNTIPTLASNNTFTGTQTFNNTIAIGEKSFQLDPALSADGTWSGITETGTAGATLAFGDLCYFQAADSRWELADANLSAGYDKKLGMCVLAAAADGSATEMLLIGKIRADANFPTLTIGSPVYMAETAGDVVVAQPTTADVCIRVIGYGNTADELYFNPSQDYIIHV